MNCTVCGKSHSKEQPLTIHTGHYAYCPDCLKELETSDHHFDIGEYLPNCRCSIKHVTIAAQEIRRPTGFVLSDRILSTDEIGKATITTKGTIKVGTMELPIKEFELT